MQQVRLVFLMGFFAGLPLWAVADETELELAEGKAIYAKQCASCHGTLGQGVAGKYDETLYGDKSITALTKIIHDTMPEEDPGTVVGDDALAVAKFMMDTFYTAEARAKNSPPRIELVRLTNTQYANTVADLMAEFLGRDVVENRSGLSAKYYNSRNFRENEKKFDRIDPNVSFQFKDESPGEEIKAEEFSIQWQGAIYVDETGDYEFNVLTENGFRLWINNQETALIDGWVASGADPSDHKATIHLLGGRAYPVRLDYFKFKEKSASIELRWTPPGRPEAVIPEQRLSPRRVAETYVVTTPFPPDDASLGYERGTAVSKAWTQAATQSAVDVAKEVVQRINRLAGTRDDDEQREEKIKKFCGRFAELAFRRPLNEEQRQLYIEQQFANTNDPREAVKRVVLLTLHAPHFLYPELIDGTTDAYDVATRLSYGLWDSLPDKQLLQAAARNELLQPEVVREQAARMLKDDRAKHKLRGFFHELLPFHEATDLAKDSDAFPMFDREFVSDLKTSLELFIDDVVWSERSDYRELLLSSDMYLNARLAQYYGAELTGNGQFERVSFDPQQRAGVVTHPFLLSTLAYHQSSSPIHRGVFVTRKILSRSLKPPPMAIEFKDSRFDPTLTMREKVTELTKSKACMTCHSIINPLGFSLENYDAIGRFRTMENEKPINSSSDFVVDDGQVINLTGARDVAEFAAHDELAQLGFIEHLFHHCVKQPARAYGDDTLDTLRNRFISSDFHIQKLLIEINTLAALQGVGPTPGTSP